VQLQAEHPKSRHICTAFRVGIETIIERANDDGEPSGSAGPPILRQIHSFELENIGIAVVRYFGGTLLGVSGLITAYKTAAQLAIEQADMINKQVEAIYRINCGYDAYHNLMNYIKQQDFIVYEQTLAENCQLLIGVPVNSGKIFEDNLVKFTGLNYSFETYS